MTGGAYNRNFTVCPSRKLLYNVIKGRTNGVPRVQESKRFEIDNSARKNPVSKSKEKQISFRENLKKYRELAGEITAGRLLHVLVIIMISRRHPTRPSLISIDPFISLKL